MLSRTMSPMGPLLNTKTIVILKIRHWTLETSQEVVRMRETDTPSSAQSTVAAVAAVARRSGCVGPESWESGQSHLEHTPGQHHPQQPPLSHQPSPLQWKPEQ